MRFIIFVIDGPGNPASADEMKHIDAFNEKLQNNGHWITAAGIRPGSNATLIDNRNNKGDVKPGSLFDAPEFTAASGSSKQNQTSKHMSLRLKVRSAAIAE